jgi:hypothetical protein
MAATGSSKRVAIAYGFSEGRLTASHLRAALLQAGYELSSMAQADIIISHSGGFLVLPRKTTAQTLVLIGACTWDKPVILSLAQKLVYEFKHRKQHGGTLRWLARLGRNCMYACNIPFSVRMIWRYQLRKKPSGYQRLIAVRNQHDPYSAASILLWPEISAFISVPGGGHDDVWLNPEPYVEILRRCDEA